MKRKWIISILVVASLLFSFGVAPVGASGGALMEDAPSLDKAKFVTDEILVKFRGDKRLFRVIKIPEGKVVEKIKEYLKRADVESAEPNYYAYAL